MATTPSTLDEFPCQLDTEFRKDGTVVVYRERPKRWWGRGTTEEWCFVKDIGSGASGIVWLEEERWTRQLRAVKRMDLRGSALRKGNLEGLSSMERNLRRELQTLISLRSCEDLFVQFHGWYRGNEYIYFAMEYVEHGNLGGYLRQYPEQARVNVVEITKQILKGLAVLHERHICHRDLKPQNILVASLSPIHIKLADFGVSKCAKDTKLKTQVGTLLYQAPELLGLLPRAIQRGEEYTNAIDMWALGCIIYEISTTEMPFLRKQHDMISQISGIDYAGLDGDASTLRVDIGLLHAYCSGDVGLTMEVLRSQVGDRGVDFVERLLVPDPGSRISVADALNHRWMFDFPEIFDENDGSEILRGQFLSLGIELSSETMESLMLELRRRRDVDINQFLPSSSRKNIGNLQRISAAQGYTLILDMLFGFQSRSASNPDDGMNIDSTAEIVLQVAVESGYLEMVKMLLERGANVDASLSDEEGRTTLQAAAGSGHLEVVRLLLEKGSNINAPPCKYRGRTALQAAAEGGHPEVARLLLERGSEVNAQPSKYQGRTALQAAAEGGHLEVVTLLLESDADMNAKASPYGGRTALQAAAEGGYFEVAKLLLRRGANINAAASFSRGRTALQAATEGGHLKIVRLLLMEGADINAEPCEIGGRTALQAAAGGGHLEVVTLLLERGADINAKPSDEEGWTALQAAAGGGHLEVITLLLERGADTNAEPSDEEGWTALQAAAGGGHLEVITLLLERGADINAEQSDEEG